MLNKDINSWKSLTNKITNIWIKDYFEIGEDEQIYFDWVSDEVGTVFRFSDYFFDFSTVLKCYELGISKPQLMDWYDFCLENQKVNISLARFILSPQEKKEQLKKQLEQSKERLQKAKEEFEKSLKEFEEKYGK